MKLILGSKSAGRRAVLDGAGFDYEAMSADIDEKAIRFEDPEKLVLALAHAKADALLEQIDKVALLITADQVVVQGGKILEKPEDEDEARKFLRGYWEYPMETVSSVVITNTQTGKRVEGVDIAKVYFNKFSEDIIKKAITDGRIMHCSGAMRCEDPPFVDYIAKFEGTKDSTSGMPLVLLNKLLDEINA